MKVPICDFCLKSGLLCPSCEEKLRRGVINKLDIKVINQLIGLEAKFPSLKNAVYHKALQLPKMLIILVSSGPGVGRPLWLRISRILSSSMGGDVRIVEKTSSLRKFVEQLLPMVKVSEVNTIWLPDGSWESIIKIPSSDLKKIPIKIETFEKVVHELTGEVIRITLG